MNTRHKRRLLLTIAIICLMALITFLVLYALKQNISLFYSPSEIVAGKVPHNRVLRLGGLVQPKSVWRSPHDLQIRFVVTDHVQQIVVNYTGILPALFREGQSVVVQGKLNKQGVFVASQILAKHDEKYMPKQVMATLKNNSKEVIYVLSNPIHPPTPQD